jgi:hypothetical protein
MPASPRGTRNAGEVSRAPQMVESGSGAPIAEGQGTARRASRRFMTLAAVASVIALVGIVPANAVTSGGWSSLGNGGGANIPALNGKVYAIVPVGSKLYFGGEFTNAGGIPAADFVAVWDGTHWSAVGAGLKGSGTVSVSVTALAVVGTTVFAGGSFSNAAGDAQADNLAMWNGSHWTSVNNTSFDGPVYALKVAGAKLYVGGGFDNAHGIAEADAIVAYDLTGNTWSAITTSNDSIDGTVSSLAVSGDGGLYVGATGAIDIEGIDAADFLARYDLSGGGWSAVGPPSPSVAPIQNRVRGLAASGSDVYVVGDFIDADGIEAADKIAKWDGVAWSALGSDGAGGGFFGEGGASGYSVAVDHDNVFMGGAFLNAGGNPLVDSIAGFRNDGWTNVGSDGAGNGPGSAIVLALATSRSKLYAGTTATVFGGSTLNGFGASFKIRQPDGRIAVGSGTSVGNNTYNTTGAGQAKATNTAPGGTATFSMVWENDGFATDSFLLTGPGSGSGFTVTYLRGTTNVTSQVVAGTLTFSGVAPGATRSLKLKVTVGHAVSSGTTRSWLVTAASEGISPPVRDAVKATVKVS